MTEETALSVLPCLFLFCGGITFPLWHHFPHPFATIQFQFNGLKLRIWLTVVTPAVLMSS